MHSLVFHVSNLHCGSCVNAIAEALAQFCPTLTVQVSVVLQTVTVYHHDSLYEKDIRSILESQGFDVEPIGKSPQNFEKHLAYCVTCQQQRASPSKITLAVGGMTCSTCMTAVTRALSETDGVQDITVSLINNSATFTVDDGSLLQKAQGAVEDCGFEALVVSVQPLNPSASSLSSVSSRSISLHIGGMFCSHCPQKILDSLKTFGDRVHLLTAPTLANPVLTISYVPNPPLLTIRTIIGTLKAVSVRYNVTVWHPPTIEEHSRTLQIREQRDYLSRLAFTVVFAIPTFIIGIVYMSLVKSTNPTKEYLMLPMWSGNVPRSVWALFFLSTPVMFYSANVFHLRSIKEIRALWRRKSQTPIWKRFLRFGSMNLLVSSGVSVAYFASVALLVLAATQPAEVQGDSLTYFDSVVFLTMFLLAGRYLEAFSKARTADAVTSLAALRPEKALLVSKGPQTFNSIVSDSRDIEKAEPGLDAAFLSSSLTTKVEPISVDLLEVGDVVRVLTGSSPPADGEIVAGEHGLFDESSLTGESKPVLKVAGDRAFLGTINRGDIVHIRVHEVGGLTMLDKIVKIVREGQTRRAPMERVADVVTSYFVPVVTLLAILTWLIWLGLGLTGRLPANYLDTRIGGWPLWSLEFAVAVFVVACPCGIGLAAPTALLVGTGLAAKFGVLARGGGEAFQEMAQVDVVVFDKTGTLTEGVEPRVCDVEYLPGTPWDAHIILGVAAELETASSHIIAVAIRDYCLHNGEERQHGQDFQEYSGKGLRARFDELGATAIIGSGAWMEEHGIRSTTVEFNCESWKTEGKSVVFLAMRPDSGSGFILLASFAIMDKIRPEASGVIRWLHSRDIATWMISGDNVTTAHAVARLVGIPATNVIAGVLPHEKVEKIQSLQQTAAGSSKRSVVAMIGDGINDAPALAIADVGIAIGSGSDVAVSSAPFVLLSSSLQNIIILVNLSRCIIRRVKFNFAWALVYNLIALPVAAGVIYPAGHARLDPVWASLSMALSSLSVICSSLALKFYRPPTSSTV